MRARLAAVLHGRELEGGGGLRLFLVLGGVAAIVPLAIDMYLPALPEITRSLRTSATLLELTLAANWVGLAVGQLVVGPLSDAFGRRRPLLLGLVGFIVTSLACAVAPSIEALIALRFLQGLTGATGIVLSRAIVRDVYSGDRAAYYFSRLILITGLVPILAPSLGSQVLRFGSWREIFVLIAAGAACLFVVAIVALPETLPAGRRQPAQLRGTLRTFGTLCHDRRFVPYALVVGLALGGIAAYIAGASFVFQEIHGVSPQTFSFIFAGNAIGMVIIAQINAALVGRVSPRRRMFAAAAIAAVGGVAVLAVTLRGGLGIAWTIVPLSLVLTGSGATMMNGTAFALTHQGHVAGSASALMGMLQFGIGSIVAPLVGVAGPRSAVPMAAIMALFSVASLVVLTVTVARGRLARARGEGEGEDAPARGGGDDEDAPVRRR